MASWGGKLAFVAICSDQNCVLRSWKESFLTFGLDVRWAGAGVVVLLIFLVGVKEGTGVKENIYIFIFSRHYLRVF